MSTECYALVRGSAMRVTGLTKFGGFPDEIAFSVSRAVVKIAVNEVTESGGNEILRNDEDEPRLHFVTPEQTVRFTADIDFVRCDPGMLNLVTGVPVVENDSGDIVGFDGNVKMPAVSFGLEVWSRLAGSVCADGSPKYGYTLFPWLKGGFLSGFTFADGLVSFNLRNAFVQRYGSWGYGPYDIPMEQPVSRNLRFRQFITEAQPPTQTDGTSTFTDSIDGGSASSTTGDSVDGGSASSTTGDIIDGGTAA